MLKTTLEGNTIKIIVGEGDNRFDMSATINRPSGVPDRMGAVEENVGHCSWHPNFTLALEAYLDRFLLGKEDGDSTDILRSKYMIDRETWISWDTTELK